MKLKAGVALLAMVAAAPEMQYFRYERPIQKEKTGQSCLVIDAGIFAHAAPQLADLRLYRAGVETPFVLQRDAPEQAEDQQISPLNLGVRGGETVFDAHLPDGHYSDVVLDLKAQNFIATVTVTGSQTEAGNAETKLGTYTVFDLTSQKLGRSTVLHLPESDFPYLHFRIKGPVKPEGVAGLTVFRFATTPAKYETVAESTEVAQKGHSSVLEITVPANVPVDRIAFTAGESPSQFSRRATITVAPVASTDADQPGPRDSFSGDLLRIHSVQNGQRIDEEQLTIEAASDSVKQTKWTIAIDNGDDLPLNVESVQLQMLERSLCFDAAGSVGYLLMYGDPVLSAPSYDYAKLFTGQANATQLQAGPEQPNPAYQPRPDMRPFTEKHPALLWAILGAVILLLGLIALRSVKTAIPPRA
jgi:hypothetical protein